MLRFVTSLALTAIASAAVAQTPDASMPPAGYELSSEQRAAGVVMVEEAGQALLDSLNDPASARYRDVFLRTTMGRDGLPHVTVCGQVNAKNSMGGYTGWQVFAYSGGAVGLIVGRGSYIDASMVCERSRGHWDATDYADQVAEKAKLED